MYRGVQLVGAQRLDVDLGIRSLSCASVLFFGLCTRRNMSSKFSMYKFGCEYKSDRASVKGFGTCGHLEGAPPTESVTKRQD